MKKQRKKVKRRPTLTKWYFVFAGLFVFPIVVGVIYGLPLPQIIAVDAGDLLAYYGVAFGLFGSFYKYSEDKRKDNKERLQAAVPAFYVSLRKNTEYHKNVFNIEIELLKEQTISNVYLYDVFIKGILRGTSEDYSIKQAVVFDFDKEYEQELQHFQYVTIDGVILEDDGYPKTIDILCDDAEGNTWVCEFHKKKDGETPVYRPLPPWIL